MSDDQLFLFDPPAPLLIVTPEPFKLEEAELKQSVFDAITRFERANSQ